MALSQPGRSRGRRALRQQTADGMSIEVLGEVTAAQAEAVLRLAAAAAAADGTGPLSEQVRLHLRYGGDAAARNLLLYASGHLAGYAHLDPPGPEGRSGELVIHPAGRGRGLGLALARALLAQRDGAQVCVWAHGDLPAARRLAAAAAFSRARALWQMRRPLRDPLPPAVPPAGVSFRTFRPGADEDAWLRVNARAFASHPEQGQWVSADLDRREQEPWFDPAGFFLAERDGRLAGFHWTKVHAPQPESAAAAPGQPGPVGEVYVVGVDPAAQGGGLGRALTLAGLHYLRERGLPEVMLYVDEANTAAIRLYASLGFAHSGTDVMFCHPG